MPSWSLIRTAATTAVSALAVAAAVVPAAAQSKPLASLGTAKVKTVDGPGQLTITVGRRTLPVRLHAVELPQPGECGAAETTAALSGFVRRAPGKFSYALVKTKTGFERDASGRFLAIVAYRGSRSWRDLGDDLLRVGWGRSGEAATGDALRPVHGDVPRGAHSADGSSGSAVAARRVGVWALCGGRVHLPLGQPAPASAAPVWNVDEFGIAKSIGPLTLSATLTPAGSLTLGRLGETAPVEFTHSFFGCTASIPSLQLEAWSTGFSGACADAPVLLLRPNGPDPARLSRGGGVGLPVKQTQAAYPLLDLDNPAGWLSGGRRQWAWQTSVDTGEQEESVVTDLLSYQTALMPDT